MNMNDVTIRLEKSADHSAVENLIREAFWNVYRPGCSEHYVIHVLRDDPAFIPELDFVMERDGRLIGQNMFMKTVINADDGRVIPVLTMGPICITPELKRRGFGKKLLDYTLEKAAAMGAKYHLLIDFHGTSKPAGLQRTYPNVLNYEGVRGLEHLKWGTADQVVYECTIPFIRMAAGPLDYTPGAMRNATQKNFRPVSSEAMSQGTRCRQLAEYIVLDAPLAMLCDSPSNYYSEEECTEFIASVPTSWDETVMVSGEIGEYVAIARRKGEKWYVGAITNWTPREMDLELGFITSASVMTVFHDGANADKVARDYMKEEEDFPENGRVRIKMAPGGGWAAIIK